jgi:hypothetical protein
MLVSANVDQVIYPKEKLTMLKSLRSSGGQSSSEVLKKRCAKRQTRQGPDIRLRPHL